jgi:hypothetical protein
MDALRARDGALLTTDEVASHVIAAKGFDAGGAILRKVEAGAIKLKAGLVCPAMRLYPHITY